MKKYNIIVIFDSTKENVLMCKRTKDPYKGLYNLVGGKIENEDYLNEAYRELEEETNIKRDDVDLIHLINFTYIDRNYELQTYYGFLTKDVEIIEEVNKLEWIPKTENFFNLEKFAGEGNIGHIMENIKLRENK